MQDQAWKHFQEWAKHIDPDGDLTEKEKVELYKQAVKTGKIQRPLGCTIKLDLFANKESVTDLNAFLKAHMPGFNKKLENGDMIGLDYHMNMGLDGLVPKNTAQMDQIVAYINEHPDGAYISADDKDRLLESMEGWVDEAREWYAKVYETRNLFMSIFKLNDIAIKEAMKGAVNNEVTIE